MPNTMVVDLSHWNVVPSSLKPAREAGVVGIIHKMTEGMGGVDATADNRKYLANQAGLEWGLYHFLRPGDMVAQANHFIDNANLANVLDSDTLVAADYEDANVSLAQLQQFMTTLEELTGRQPVLYSGHVLKDKGGGNAQPSLKKYRLWLAQYASKPTLPSGWSKYWLWQWTDNGTIPGIDPPTDCNDYQGSTDQLLSEWAGWGDVQPQPEPTPETITIRVIVPPNVVVEVEETGE
jgi:GH25 family lysozyme M1 (1,4-beta-N-acetylmuramidase)